MATLSASMTCELPTEPDEDAALFLAWRSHGNQQALTTLVQRLTPPLWSLARRITGHDADAEDALQHGLLQVVRHAHAYSRGSVRSWIMAVVANAARNQRRAATRRRQAEQRAALEQPLSYEPPGPGGGDELRVLLEALPEHERVPLCLHLIDGWALAEVAAALGRSLNTVRSQVRRGLDRLTEQARRHGLACSEAGLASALATLRMPVPHQLASRLQQALAGVTPPPAGSARLPLTTALVGVVVLTLCTVGMLLPEGAPAPGHVAGAATASTAWSPGTGDQAAPPLALGAAALLQQPITIALRHRSLPEALVLLASRLPRGTGLSCSYPVDDTNDHSPAVAQGITYSTRLHAQPVRQVIDAIASQSGLTWQLLHGQVVFLRHLSPAQRQAWSTLVARLHDPALASADAAQVLDAMQRMPGTSDDPQCLRDVGLLALDRSHPALAALVDAHGYAWFQDNPFQSTGTVGYGPWAAADSPALRALLEPYVSPSQSQTQPQLSAAAVMIAGQLADARLVPVLWGYLVAHPAAAPVVRGRMTPMLIDRSGWPPYVTALEQIGADQLHLPWSTVLSLANPGNNICTLAGLSGDPALLEPLRTLMRQPAYATYGFGNQAMDALMLLPESAIGPQVRDWIRTSVDFREVATAAGALSAWGHAADAAALQRRLEDPLEDGDLNALLVALGGLGDARCVPFLLDFAAQLPGRSIHQHWPWPVDLRETVAQALATLPDDAEAALAHDAATDSDPARITLVGEALARSANPLAIQDLLQALQTQPPGSCRMQLLVAAAASGDDGCEAMALTTLRHPHCNPVLAKALVRALHDSRTPATVTALLDLLRQPVPTPLKLCVLSYLPTMPGVDLDQALTSVIRSPTMAVEVRGAALLALSSADRWRESALLLQLVHSDPDPYVRACAAAVIPARQGAALISALASDTSPLVRRFAAARLTDNEPGAIAALEAALSDTDPAVRITVAQALSEQVCCAKAAIQNAVRDRLQAQAGIETNAQVQQALQQAELGQSPSAAPPGTGVRAIGEATLTIFNGPSWSTPLYAPVFSSDPSAPPSSPFGNG